MRNLALILFCFLFFKSVAQDVWAPSGATWYYNYNSFWNEGYVEIKNIGDTVIQDQLCQVLEKKRYWYDNIQMQHDSVDLGLEYTYLDSGVVFYQRHDQFFKLYDFNAEVSDTWEIAGWNDFDVDENCDSIGSLYVDSTDVFTYNMYTLDRIYVSPEMNSDWSIYGQIIERIGAMSYMFPEVECLTDLPEGGPLRCYYDQEFGWYQVSSLPCDYTIDVNEISSIDIKVQSFPNPFSSSFEVSIESNSNGNYLIQMYSSVGELQKSFYTNEKRFEINGIDLSSGIYLLRVTDQYNRKTMQRLFKSSN